MYKVESLDHYGRGIAKINGKIVFIKNAITDEEVNLNIYNEKKSYLEASVTDYVKTSSDRTNVDCPYYDNCGGCNIMHIKYEKQLKFKEEKIKNIISKYLDSNIHINSIIKSNQIFNYRNKVTFQVKQKIGFFNDNSYELIRIDNCLISNKLINDSIKYLNKLNLEKVKKIMCRATNKLMIIIETDCNDLNIDCLKSIGDSIYLKLNNTYYHVFGDKKIYENIGEYKFVISPDSFFQINIDICTKLYEKIKEYVGHNKNVLDLYCGTGTIGIFVNKNNNIIGIEKNQYAIEDANENKKTNNLDNVKFICGDSGKELDKLNSNIDAIIVDPPRSGLNKKTIDNIINTKSKIIVYVSCDPMTLVRDLKILSKYYTIKEITPFDMFPNTYHVESVCLLEKK